MSAPVLEELENNQDTIDDKKDAEPVGGELSEAAEEEVDFADEEDEEEDDDEGGESGCECESERSSGVGSGDSALRYIANTT